MAKTIINSVDDFLALNGQSLGVSDWFEVSQDVINHFADATYDHQWIHVNPDKAKNDSPYGTTIAHGNLTLSLLPHLLDEILEVNNLIRLVNYSIKNMVYKNVVKSGSKIRLYASLIKAKDLGNICQAEIGCKLEIEGQENPALEGLIIFLYYFQ